MLLRGVGGVSAGLLLSRGLVWELIESILIHSLHVGWRNLVQASLIFAITISFMLFTQFLLVYVLYFEEFLIHDSRGFMILKKI